MGAKEKRAQEIMAEIRTVLLNDWDPLGLREIAPDDEYDAYIGEIYRLLTQHPTVEEVTRHLLRIEGRHMGLKRKRRETLVAAAEKLLRIDVRLNIR